MKLPSLLPVAALALGSSSTLGAQLTSFGQACSGTLSALPSIGVHGLPIEGFPVELRLEGDPFTFGMLLAGTSNTSWGGLSLPFDLGLVGASGCSLLVSLDQTETFWLGLAGEDELFLPALWAAGTAVHFQLWVAPSLVLPQGGFSAGLSLRALLAEHSLMISEIQHSPASPTVFSSVQPSEYFELFNPSLVAVDLDGWTLRDDFGQSLVLSAPNGELIVPPRGYVVLGHEDDPDLNGNLVFDYELGDGYTLLGDDTIELVDPSGFVVDRVTWDNGPVWPYQKGYSLELGAQGLATGQNADPGAWALSTCSLGVWDTSSINPDFGTPGRDNLGCYASSPNLLVTHNATDEIWRVDADTGALQGFFADTDSNGLEYPGTLQLAPGGRILVVDTILDRVLEYDALSSSYLGAFLDSGDFGLDQPTGLLVDGDFLYVSDWSLAAVHRFDVRTGAPAPAPGQPNALFLPSGAGGLVDPEDMAFGPDGAFYVADRNGHAVRRYDGVSGAPLGIFGDASQAGSGLQGAEGLLFEENGDLLVASTLKQCVYRFEAGTGNHLGCFLTQHGRNFEWGLDGVSYLAADCSGIPVRAFDAQGNTIYEVDASLFGCDMGVLLLPRAPIYFTGTAVNVGRGVLRMDPLEFQIELVSQVEAGFDVQGLALDAAGQVFFAVGPSSGSGPVTARVDRADPLTGLRTTLAQGGALVDPRGLDIAPTGQIVVADASGKLILIDADGTQTVVATGGLLAGPGSGQVPVDVVVEGTTAYVPVTLSGVSSVTGWLVAVSLLDGTQVLVHQGNYESVELAENGDLLLLGTNGQLFRMTPSFGGGAQPSPLATFLLPFVAATAGGPTLDDTGRVVLIDAAGFFDTLHRVDPRTGRQILLHEQNQSLLDIHDTAIRRAAVVLPQAP